MTSTFEVQAISLGFRGHYAASVHGTEGRALPEEAAIIDYWANQFHWQDGAAPIYILKVLGPGGTSPKGVADQLRRAKGAGFTTILQVRDDEPAGRDVDAAISLVTSSYDLLRDTYDIVPDVLAYRNEPEFNNQQAESWEANHKLLADVHWGLRARSLHFAAGGYASWQMLPKQLGAELGQLHADLRIRLACITTHHYNGQPSLPVEHGYKALIDSIAPGVPLAMTEGDLTAAGSSFEEDLWGNRGAAFAVDHNLTLAAAGIYCCDFTLQTSFQGADGNGFFKYSGEPHPSGTAMVEIVGPFTREPLLQVDRSSAWDTVSAFFNRAGQFVITNHIGDPLETAKKWMNMSAGVTSVDHIQWSAVRDWLTGVAPDPPSYAPQWEPDWDALEARYAQSVADAAAASKSVLVQLPQPFKHVEVLAGVGLDGASFAIDVNGRNLTATMPQEAVVYGQLR